MKLELLPIIICLYFTCAAQDYPTGEKSATKVKSRPTKYKKHKNPLPKGKQVNQANAKSASDTGGTDFCFEDAGNFCQGRAPVKFKGKWGYINPNGKIIIGCKYEKASNFSNGYAPAAKVVDSRTIWGYVDTNGKEYKFEYDHMT